MDVNEAWDLLEMPKDSKLDDILKVCLPYWPLVEVYDPPTIVWLHGDGLSNLITIALRTLVRGHGQEEWRNIVLTIKGLFNPAPM